MQVNQNPYYQTRPLEQTLNQNHDSPVNYPMKLEQPVPYQAMMPQQYQQPAPVMYQGFPPQGPPGFGAPSYSPQYPQDNFPQLANQRSQSMRQLAMPPMLLPFQQQQQQPPHPQMLYNNQTMPQAILQQQLMGNPQGQYPHPPPPVLNHPRGQTTSPQGQEIRETFFDKFGQDQQDKVNASLIHQDKARRLREELEQQILEKQKRKEEEKLERERWEMRYGNGDTVIQHPPTKNTSTAQQQLYFPGGGGGGGVGGGASQPPNFGGNHNTSFTGNPNNTFNPSQLQHQAPSQPVQASTGIGALPTSNSSPHRNANQMEEYKKELNQQIEERKRIKDLEKKKKQEEDERDELRVKKEMEEMNKRYNQEANPNPPSFPQQDQQQPPPVQEEKPPQKQAQNTNLQRQRTHLSNQQQVSHDWHNQSVNNSRIVKQQSRRIEVRHPPIDFNQDPSIGPDSQPPIYHDEKPVYVESRYQENYREPKRQEQQFQSQQSLQKKSQQQAPSGNNFNDKPIEMPQHQQQNKFNTQQLPPLAPSLLQQQPMMSQPPLLVPPLGLPLDTSPFEPFKQQLQTQLVNFQKDILKLQNQQKQMMKNYHKEIEQLQAKKQQIISEMKTDQDIQMKMQLQQLSSAIEHLNRKMSIAQQQQLQQQYQQQHYPQNHHYQDYHHIPYHHLPPIPPPPRPFQYHSTSQSPTKEQLVADVLAELKQVIPQLAPAQQIVPTQVGPSMIDAYKQPTQFSNINQQQQPLQQHQQNQYASQVQRVPNHQVSLPKQQNLQKQGTIININSIEQQSFQPPGAQSTNLNIPQPNLIPAPQTLQTNYPGSLPPRRNDPEEPFSDLPKHIKIRNSLSLSPAIVEPPKPQKGVELPSTTVLMPHESPRLHDVKLLRQAPKNQQSLHLLDKKHTIIKLNPPGIYEDAKADDSNTIDDMPTVLNQLPLKQQETNLTSSQALQQMESYNYSEQSLRNKPDEQNIQQEQQASETSEKLQEDKISHNDAFLDHLPSMTSLMNNSVRIKVHQEETKPALEQFIQKETEKEDVTVEVIQYNDTIKQEQRAYKVVSEPGNPIKLRNMAPVAQLPQSLQSEAGGEVVTPRDNPALSIVQKLKNKNKAEQQVSNQPQVKQVIAEIVDKRARGSLESQQSNQQDKFEESQHQTVQQLGVQSRPPPSRAIQQRQPLHKKGQYQEHHHQGQDLHVPNKAIHIDQRHSNKQLLISESDSQQPIQTKKSLKQSTLDSEQDQVVMKTIQLMGDQMSHQAVTNSLDSIKRLKYQEDIIQLRSSQVSSEALQEALDSIRRMQEDGKNKHQCLMQPAAQIQSKQSDGASRVIKSDMHIPSGIQQQLGVEEQSKVKIVGEQPKRPLNKQVALTEALDTIKQTQAHLESVLSMPIIQRGAAGGQSLLIQKQQKNPLIDNAENKEDEKQKAQELQERLILEEHKKMLQQQLLEQQHYQEYLRKEEERRLREEEAARKEQEIKRQMQLEQERIRHEEEEKRRILEMELLHQKRQQYEQYLREQELLQQREQLLQLSMDQEHFRIQQQQMIQLLQAEQQLKSEVTQQKSPVLEKQRNHNLSMGQQNQQNQNSYYQQMHADGDMDNAFLGDSRNNHSLFNMTQPQQHRLSAHDMIKAAEQIIPPIEEPPYQDVNQVNEGSRIQDMLRRSLDRGLLPHNFDDEFIHYAEDEDRIMIPVEGEGEIQSAHHHAQQQYTMEEGEKYSVPQEHHQTYGYEDPIQYHPQYQTIVAANPQLRPTTMQQNSRGQDDGHGYVLQPDITTSEDQQYIKLESHNYQLTVNPPVEDLPQVFAPSPPPWRMGLAQNRESPLQPFAQESEQEEKVKELISQNSEINRHIIQLSQREQDPYERDQSRVHDLQHQLSQDQQYLELQYHERKIQSQIQSEEKPKEINREESQEAIAIIQPSMPDFTNFQYNKFLVEGEEADTIYDELHQKLQASSSPTRFLLAQPPHLPSDDQYQLQKKQTQPDARPPARQNPTQLILKQIQQPQQHLQEPLGMKKNVPSQSPSIMMRPVTKAAPRNEDHNLEQETNLNGRMREISRMAYEYDKVKKQVEDSRTIAEKRNLRELSLNLKQQLKQAEEIFKDKESERKRQRIQQNESINIGDEQMDLTRNIIKPDKGYISSSGLKPPLQDPRKIAVSRSGARNQVMLGSSASADKLLIHKEIRDSAKKQSISHNDEIVMQSQDGTLNIADAQSSSDQSQTPQAKKLEQLKQMAEADKNLKLPEIQVRPSTSAKGAKFLREMVKTVPTVQLGQGKQVAKPPLPPIQIKQQPQPPTEAVSSNIANGSQQHFQLPIIRQSTISEESDTSSVINIFNTNGHSSQQEQAHSMQMQRYQTFDSNHYDDLFVKQPTAKPDPTGKDPFTLQARLREQLQETSQMMRVDNINLLQKVQAYGRVVKPSNYLASGGLPPIIDIAENAVILRAPTPKSNSQITGFENAHESGIVEQEGDGGAFSQTFKQWEVQRTKSKQTNRYNGGIGSQSESESGANIVILQQTQAHQSLPMSRTSSTNDVVLSPLKSQRASRTYNGLEQEKKQMSSEVNDIHSIKYEGSSPNNQGEATYNQSLQFSSGNARLNEVAPRNSLLSLNLNQQQLHQDQDNNRLEYQSNSDHHQPYSSQQTDNNDSYYQSNRGPPVADVVYRVVEHTVETPRYLIGISQTAPIEPQRIEQVAESHQMTEPVTQQTPRQRYEMRGEQEEGQTTVDQKEEPHIVHGSLRSVPSNLAVSTPQEQQKSPEAQSTHLWVSSSPQKPDMKSNNKEEEYPAKKISANPVDSQSAKSYVSKLFYSSGQK